MLTEIPILSQGLCYLAEWAIAGNPIYPKFNVNKVDEKCEEENCRVKWGGTNGLGMFINSGKFRPIVGGVGEWKECDTSNQMIALIFA